MHFRDFTLTSFEQNINEIQQWIGAPLSENAIHFDNHVGQGHLYFIQMEDGLFVRSWDYILEDDGRFHIKPADAGADIIFTISYLITPEHIAIETKRAGHRSVIKRLSKLTNIVITCNKDEFYYHVDGEKKTGALDICFTEDWLKRQYPFKPNIDIAKLLREHTSEATCLLETFSTADYKIAGEIMEKLSGNEWDNIFLKSRVMTLLEEIFKNLDLKTGVEKRDSSKQVQAMIQVEKKLISLLNKKPPNLKEIAKEFSMSESTLKRQFKQVYGKTIYEYYLDKKMDLAKRILLQDETTVSQIAYSLGYEKVSSFTTIFKKHFGESPGSLRTSLHENLEGS